MSLLGFLLVCLSEQLWPITNTVKWIAKVNEIEGVSPPSPFIFKVINLESAVWSNPNTDREFQSREEQTCAYHLGWMGAISTPIT